MTRFQNVTGDNRKPWDERLMEWMQRGSGEACAGSKRTWTPKQRAAYGVWLIVWVSFLVSTNGRHVTWWVYPVIVVAGAIVDRGLYLWERKRSA